MRRAQFVLLPVVAVVGLAGGCGASATKSTQSTKTATGPSAAQVVGSSYPKTTAGK